MPPHIAPIDLDQAPAATRAAHDAEQARHGRVTNMKRTLLHSVPAFEAYMAWYTLYDRLLPVFGERALWLFCHAISSDTDCLICSTFFRRLLIDAGIQPADYEPDAGERALIRFGRQFAGAAGARPDPEAWAALRDAHAPAVLVDLAAFGGLMVATNLFNNVVGVDLDAYLEDYRKPAASSPR